MSRKILLIEQDPCLASLLSYPLSREGYFVNHTDGMESGLSEAKSRLYDLIVFDMENAESEFSSLLHQLRRCYLIETPILILSSNGDESLIARMLRMGAEDYLVKPFQVEHFLARVHAIVRRRPGSISDEEPSHAEQTEPAIEIGTMLIDPEKYEVSCGGIDVSVTAKEFWLLLRLAEKCGAVISKNDLALQLGPIVNPKSCRKVDVYMSNLRKKIEPYAAVRIETVRGRGYKLVAAGRR
jgi:two-component system alkaline phosphatase synthesis response regulator PhoP